MKSSGKQAPPSLQGLRVLVTRPAHQQQAFVDLLEKEGAMAVSLPCLEIEPLYPDASAISALAEVDTVVFTSVNAVENFVKQALSDAIGQQNIFAVGPSTAKALKFHGFHPVCEPGEPFNSEALLEDLQTCSQNIQSVAIVKGCGGRGLLEQCLAHKGIKTQIIDVYQRVCPVYTDTQISKAFLNSATDIVTITSNEALNNLVNIAGQSYQRQLFEMPMVVNSERGAILAKSLGFRSQIYTAATPGDVGQLDAIKKWSRSSRSNI